MTTKQAEKIYKLLKKNYPRAKIALTYSNPWELLVTVILSAQCTDKRVNIVTEKLFAKYTSIESFAGANVSEFECDIRSTGFYRNKAKNIISAAKKIITEHRGKVPQTMEELTALPGVARKTANIVLYNAFGKVCGIPVDTHVGRLSQRLGLSGEKNPVKIEKDLMRLFPEKYRGKLSHLLIEHGRNICKARKPLCGECFLNGLCPKKTFSK